MLRNLGFAAVPLHGQMQQTKRLGAYKQILRICFRTIIGALNKFKSKERNILVATDVASRGLDIPDVDLVINYDIPLHKKVWIILNMNPWSGTRPIFGESVIGLRASRGPHCTRWQGWPCTEFRSYPFYVRELITYHYF